ncbi:hypothetical protein K402DRAFT_391302 [Aulographum hederae CBS 113979]|uniref:Uncharacterized protein n=1 Tax=Aulographum hederae CBS 113979 TaxID=1176131 RepID=A0A6G1H7D1_9PEZI|nr:hypothetical protein K402DRAFT_391302 [Aulographum hederae CBS 113979]
MDGHDKLRWCVVSPHRSPPRNLSVGLPALPEPTSTTSYVCLHSTEQLKREESFRHHGKTPKTSAEGHPPLRASSKSSLPSSANTEKLRTLPQAMERWARGLFVPGDTETIKMDQGLAGSCHVRSSSRTQLLESYLVQKRRRQRFSLLCIQPRPTPFSITTSKCFSSFRPPNVPASSVQRVISSQYQSPPAPSSITVAATPRTSRGPGKYEADSVITYKLGSLSGNVDCATAKLKGLGEENRRPWQHAWGEELMCYKLDWQYST